MAALPVYSSRNVQVFWGTYFLDGLAPDSFITATRSEDFTDEEVGADGKLSTSISPDRTGTVVITLQQQSLSNKVLAGVVKQQELEDSLLIGDLLIKDLSGGILSNHRRCYLKSAPEQSVGSTATGSSRPWTFFVEKFDFASLTETDGANPLVAAKSSVINSAVSSIRGAAEDALSGFADDAISGILNNIV